jgi:hypothetical protein
VLAEWLEAKIVRVEKGNGGGVEYAVMDHGRKGAAWNVLRDEINVRSRRAWCRDIQAPI